MTTNTPPQLQDPLVRHYFELILMIEQLVLDSVPRLPLMPAPKPPATGVVIDLAEQFAAAHDIRGQA